MYKLLIITATFLLQTAIGQEQVAPASQTMANTASAPIQSSTAELSGSPNAAPATATLGSLLDYKSVYEAPTVEEEVMMATERFHLTPDQQNLWMGAAIDRRQVEKAAMTVITSSASVYDKEGSYRGLRTAHNEFHDIIIGHLSPAQKTALEADRLVLNEKQKKIAKLPPPPPPAPIDTVAPVDSTSIKAAEDEKAKAKGKKKKKKSTIKQ